ncbi:MAG: CHAT domain-containing protein [Chloroflexi bacterium]|nr:CHAT domain-containing protein [Chloroflexota bacterium]MCI0578313.1 CHAT domain-containing protein [Chloroflexota bacterium]MCI0649019.1 CHAT domain-containing protein [Chloroflexota bacterium]MCI0729454.1 CHAT domain-containing protein [Chloroflexota bacterium]
MEQFYRLIAQHFGEEEIKELAHDLGVYVSLGNPSVMARQLFEDARRRLRLDTLYQKVSGRRPGLDLQPYLYELIAASFSEAEMATLCRSLGVDKLNLGLDADGLLGWDYDDFIKRNKAWTLQEQMRQAGRWEELLAELQRLKPKLALAVFRLDRPRQEDRSDAPQTQHSIDRVEQPKKALQYENFDIRLAHWGDKGYAVEVLYSPAGETRSLIPQLFPLDDPKFYELIQYLKGLMARPEDARTLGKWLRELLFPAEVWNLFTRSLDQVDRNGKGLRLRLRIDPPELSRLPWEYCYGGVEYDYFALNSLSPVVRYVAKSLPAERLATPQPRLLVALASPQDPELAPLNENEEYQLIEKSLAPVAGHIQWKVLKNTTLEALQRELAAGYQLLHYVGHGVIKEDGQGALALERPGGPQNGKHLVDAEQMRVLLRNSGVKAVVLTACQTAEHDEGEAFMGMAPSLVEAGVPAVVAMQFKVPYETALALIHDLYYYLSVGFPLDAALTEARKSAFSSKDDKIYWGIPVLFMRAQDGYLWQPPDRLVATPAPATGQKGQGVAGTVIYQYNYYGDYVERQTMGDEIQGDKVGGDKVGGDKVAGDKAGRDIIKGVNISGVSGGSAVSLTGDAVVGTQVKDVTGDVTVGPAAGPTREDFDQLLQDIRSEFEAIRQSLRPRDAEDAAEELADAQDEAAQTEPDGARLVRKLESVTKIAGAAGGAVAAASKLLPLIQKAIQMAPTLFGG